MLRVVLVPVFGKCVLVDGWIGVGGVVPVDIDCDPSGCCGNG